jgi:hypothetical protein
MAAARTPLTWFQDMIGMYSFRAFAGGKPSWMLSYSWEEEKQIKASDAMQNLAMAQLMAGTNTWDARGHVMSGSNDIQMRKVIFGWIKDHEKTFFLPRQPVRPIGVYFSDKTRDYFAEEFIASYRGILMLLMQSHLEFQIVTPRTLGDFQGGTLILPDVRCLGDEELSRMDSYRKSGKTLLVTGASGKYDGSGAERTSNPLLKTLGIRNPNEKTDDENFLYRPLCPGRAYYAKLQQEFDRAAAAGTFDSDKFNQIRKEFVAEVLKVWQPSVEVTASPFVSTQIAEVNGKVSVFLANFKGLRSKEVAQQIPEKNVKVTFPAKQAGTVVFLPFLGVPQKLQGKFDHGKLSVELPAIEKGAVAWVE